MQQLTVRIDRACRPAGLVQRRFDEPPFGTAYISVSPREQGEYASCNSNRVHLCGTEGGLTEAGVGRFKEFFANAGVNRFYVWLSPGPDMEVVRGWLAQCGLTRVPYVAYPTLARAVGDPAAGRTEFEIREIDATEIARLGGTLAEAAWPVYLRLAGATGFYHFAALHDGAPVASAVLCVFEELGYLALAQTAEAFRRRGAQQTLIAQRMKKAAALGCRILVSETLSILKDSLANLRKAGFETIFEKEVYEARSTT